MSYQPLTWQNESLAGIVQPGDEVLSLYFSNSVSNYEPFQYNGDTFEMDSSHEYYFLNLKHHYEAGSMLTAFCELRQSETEGAGTHEVLYSWISQLGTPNMENISFFIKSLPIPEGEIRYAQMRTNQIQTGVFHDASLLTIRRPIT